VAGGIEIARDRAPHDLNLPDQPSTVGIAGFAFAVTLILTSCREDVAAPSLPPAPPLPVVTATAGPPPVPTPGEQQRYVVREGDTLSGIAARFGVSEDAILKENPLSDRDRLFVGQELVIPPAQP